jgi:hypothetical protein
VWDFETNLANAFIFSGTTLSAILAWQVTGIPFALVHETADFALGLLFAPAVIMLIPRITRRSS